jgi:DNA gyrase subunit A
MGISELRVMGRATQGVRLIKLNGGDAIASVAKIAKEDEVEEEPIDLENNETNDNLNSDNSEAPEETPNSDE